MCITPASHHSALAVGLDLPPFGSVGLLLALLFQHHGRHTTSWEVSSQNAQSSTQRAIRPFPWTQPSTTPSPSLAEGVFTVTHPFHPLYGQQFEILTYRHNWGEYRVTFYQTPDHVRALPAAWTSLAPPDPSVMLAAGRAAFRMADLLQLSRLIERIEEGHKEEAEC